MNTNKTLKDYTAEIQACVKCGGCQAHCPVYGSTHREGGVARGKITLAASLLAGEIDLDKRLREDISLCLMCGSCVNKCPNKVPTHEIVGAIRREITDNRGLSIIGKAVSTVIGHPKVLKTLAKSGSVLSSVFLTKVPSASGLRLRFPSPIMAKRTLPQVAFKNLFERYPEFIEGDPKKPVVGIFSGCSTTYLYPDTGVAMIEILKHFGYSIYFPRSQVCCGIPALSTGNGKLVEKLAATNISSFTNHSVEYILTCCASCNGGIGEHYKSMTGNTGEFTDKVMDIHVFLKQQGLFDLFEKMVPWENPTRVTYHDPCHLKTQGITKEPRDLLKVLPNVDYVEMEGADLCCGLGGTFSVYNYEYSKQIGARKIAGLAESEATQIATACPGCIMQLQDSINHAELPVKAVHILDLLKEAL